MAAFHGGVVAAAAAAWLVLCGALLSAPVASADLAPGAAAPPVRASESTGAQVTSFFFGESYLITPVPPVNESSGQALDAPGVVFPRALLTNVGTWSVTLTEEGMVIDTLDGISVWASSDQGANNVHFNIVVQVNGNAAGTLRTVTKDTLSSTPVEFTLDPGSAQLSGITFSKGAQVTFQLQYQSSSSPLPIGPSASSTFHYYSSLYRSRVDLVTNPFNLTLASMKVDNDRVNVTEIVRDAFGVDPSMKEYFVMFNGPTTSLEAFVKLVGTLVDPINGTTLVWNWFFERQGVPSSGTYAVTLSAKYAGSEVNYSNVTSSEIKFPKPRAQAKGLLPGLGGLEAVAAIAAVAGGAVTASRVRSRGARR